MPTAGRPLQQKRSRPNSHREVRLRREGFTSIAGVDEVGRGCLFGPVVAAAVILDPKHPIRGLQDSKQINPQLRETLSDQIRQRARAFAFGAINSADIDRWNIYEATRRAMSMAVQLLNVRADFVLVDAMQLDIDIPQKSLIRGDVHCTSIAAASILAKVERDHWMRIWDKLYPQYSLSSNKGYSTPDHLKALREHGPTPLHRFSFRPVRETVRLNTSAGAGQYSGTTPLLSAEKFRARDHENTS